MDLLRAKVHHDAGVLQRLVGQVENAIFDAGDDRKEARETGERLRELEVALGRAEERLGAAERRAEELEGDLADRRAHVLAWVAVGVSVAGLVTELLT